MCRKKDADRCVGNGVTYLLAYLFNLFGLYCTMQLVKLYGVATEANPIGQWLFATNLAIPVKVVVVGAAMFALYLGIKTHPRWNWTSWLVLAVYSLLALYHIVFIRG